MPDAANVREAILECFRSKSEDVLSLNDLGDWINRHYPGRWKDIATSTADLVIDGNQSSTYARTAQCLERVGRGKYRLAMTNQAAGGGSPRAHRHGVTGSKPEKPALEETAPPIGTGRVSGTPFWIPGTPGLWATKAEAPWRKTLAQHIGSAEGSREAFTGICVHFSLESDLRNGQRFDLDNLCEAPFRVLINNQGHFGGRRGNVQWWNATRKVEQPSGCRIELAEKLPSGNPAGQVAFDGVYRGELPRRASDTDIAEWIEREACVVPDATDVTFSVSLRFASSRVNIADVSTGPTKPIIDNLFPILGGSVSKPDDWRIEHLLVRKCDRKLCDDEVRITVLAMG